MIALEQKNIESLTEILHMVSQLATQCDRILNYTHIQPNLVRAGFANKFQGYTDPYGDLQKAIVGMIRGSEFAFEELTGVKYQD